MVRAHIASSTLVLEHFVMVRQLGKRSRLPISRIRQHSILYAPDWLQKPAICKSIMRA